MTPKEGNATLMISSLGHKDYLNNIFTAIPIDGNNSQYIAEAEPLDLQQIVLEPQSCYTCWHIINVRVTDPRTTSYRLTISNLDDESGSFKELKNSNTREIYLAAGFSEKIKFILDGMDSFILSAQVATGDITMQVGLDPATVSSDDYIWKVSSNAGIAYLPIKTTDQSFHMATYYYIYIEASPLADAWFSLSLSQQRSVEFIPNDNDYTFGIQHPEYNKEALFQKYQY
mmetsp:Transcript_14852/g.25279  ORF Transcript_14852/g.25279 Transcript_14852/m.25279 type:complete len:229 (+) Transcript_14852:134-820(+)